MGDRVGRRISILSCFALLACSGAAHAGTKTPASWATPQIRAVTSAGLMGAKDIQSFHAGDALTAQALENLVFDLKARLAPEPEAGDPGNAPVGPPTVTDPTITTPVTTTATTTTAASHRPRRCRHPRRPRRSSSRTAAVPSRCGSSTRASSARSA